MASTYTQDTRLCQFSTSLPPNTLSLVEFSGTEHVNDITVYHVRAVADSLIDVNGLMGNAMEISIVLPDATNRYISLVCFSTRYLGRNAEGHLYEFELRPWFWMMNYKVNSRIFHDMTVVDILTQMFQEYPNIGGGLFEDKTSGLSTVQEYTVQYRESDLNFCRRLMEEYGINFHVEMAQGHHTLVITNDATSFPEAPGGTVKYAPSDAAMYENDVVLNTWATRQQMASHSVRLMDYNYDDPTANMESEQSRPFAHEAPELEHYDYPGDYLETGEGDQIAMRRLEGLRTHDQIVHAEGRHGTFGAGMTFQLAEHEVDPSQQGKYVVLSATITYAAGNYRSGSASHQSFHSSFTLTRDGNPIAPLQITPRPRIAGPQTAVVTTGAEVGDSLGRIEVRFHWDHSDTSILARVAQMWAGNSWGTVFVPRVGMEVVVEFLEGDPDRPIITGCVYNADNQPPWDGSAENTVSGIKSQTMGGGGYNQISIDDKPGAEDIIIHAQMDMHTTIENNEYVHVLKDAERKVDGNEKVEITGNSTRDVTGTETIKITGACVIESTTSIELKVGGQTIKLDNTGIKINGMQIELSATAKLATKGLMAEHKADGIMTIQGPMVQIN